MYVYMIYNNNTQTHLLPDADTALTNKRPIRAITAILFTKLIMLNN